MATPARADKYAAKETVQDGSNSSSRDEELGEVEVPGPNQLKRSLKNRHLQMIAMGMSFSSLSLSPFSPSS